MLFDLKSYRQCLYPLWKQKKLLQGNPPLEPEPWQEITTHDICPVYVKWLGIWLLVVFCLCCIAQCAHAEDINLDIIADIESGSNPLAYNKESGGVGEYQITEGVLTDYNYRIQGGSDNITIKDMYIPEEAIWIAKWYFNTRIPKMLNAYHIPDTIISRIIAWNWGHRPSSQVV